MKMPMHAFFIFFSFLPSSMMGCSSKKCPMAWAGRDALLFVLLGLCFSFFVAVWRQIGLYGL